MTVKEFFEKVKEQDETIFITLSSFFFSAKVSEVDGSRKNAYIVLSNGAMFDIEADYPVLKIDNHYIIKIFKIYICKDGKEGGFKNGL